MKKNNCYNCQFSGHTFKLDGLTHLHCEHPKYEKIEEVCAWDTLQEFWDTCEDFKPITGNRKIDNINKPSQSIDCINSV